MKYIKFISVSLIFILGACAKTEVEQLPENDDSGLLQIGLNIDKELQIVNTRVTSMDESLIPSVDDFYVELYRYESGASKGWWKRLHFGTYQELFEEIAEGDTDEPTTAERVFKPLRVNTGQWRLVAFHGDSVACGFDKPYFLVDKEFTVDGGVDEDGTPNTTFVEAEAKVENVRITVEFDESIPGSFYDSFVRFARIDTSAAAGNSANKRYKQILRYGVDQEKDAYMMPTDSLQIQFMAQYEYGDESSWKYVTLDTVAVKGNDHLTINLSVNPRHGNLDINITTDENIVKETTDIEILEIWAPQDAPKIVAAGFPDNDHPVVEGDKTGNNATISVLARAGLKNFYVRIDSEYLTAAGIDVPLGEEIDLANPTAENADKLAKLKAAGFSWQEDMLGSRGLTYLTMTELFTKINDLNPSLDVTRNLFSLSIRVVDDVEHETVSNLTATAYPITQMLSIDNGNVWAKKIVSPELAIERGVAGLYELQVSEDGINWTEDFRTFEAANNNMLDFGTIPTA